MLIGIPTGVKIYDWMLTMFRGRVRFTVPMLYALAFLMLFVIGGLTGIMLANPAIDYQVHNTLFLVAHFHNMLIPGLLFGMLAGYHFWFPKAFGFRLDERWGRIAFACWAGRLHARLHAALCARPAGHAAAHRRAFSSRPTCPTRSSPAVGAVLILLRRSPASFVQLWVSIRERHENRVFAGDPWDGRTLEWATSGAAAGIQFRRSCRPCQRPRRLHAA